MQQAYRSLRIVSEAQTIRIVLATHPGELMLKELSTACATLDTESSNGVKAIVLDFVVSATGVEAGVKEGPMRALPAPQAEHPIRGMGILSPRQGATAAPRPPDGVQHTIPRIASQPHTTFAPTSEVADGACAAVRGVAQPVLAVVRGTLSEAACALVLAADLTLAANDAVLTVPDAVSGNDTLTGAQAARLGHVTWAVPTQNVKKEMERVLDMLRGKSALALRYTKASVRLGQADHATKLEALGQVNTFYLTQVMKSADAHEGLSAFLEKRQPEWKNA